MSNWNLLADIGGTNTRLACLGSRGMSPPTIFDTNGPGKLEDCFVEFVAGRGPPVSVVVAVAGVVKDGNVELVNAERRSLSKELLASAVGCKRITVINDFEAAAWAISNLDELPFTPIGKVGQHQGGNRLIVGVGTGFGVGLLRETGNSWNALPVEGGHFGIAPICTQDVEVFRAIRHLWADVCFGNTWMIEAEALLSGTGLPYLFRAVSMVAGSPHQKLETHEVLTKALAGGPIAIKALDLFRTYLGVHIGNLASALDATGGVFLTGGVVANNHWLFDKRFISAFEQGGRLNAQRSSTGIYVIDHPYPGLLGAAKFLHQNLS